MTLGTEPARRRRLPMFAETESPGLLGLAPRAESRGGVHLPDSGELSPPALELLSAVREAVVRGTGPGATRVFSLQQLGETDRHEIWEMLGKGEVSIVVQGAARYEIDETALAGVFRVRTRSAVGESLHLEVGAVPAVVVAAAEHGTSPDLPLESPPPPGLMKAQPLLAELRHRMSSQAFDAPNHVMSLTHLPLSAEDSRYLARVLGAGPVTAVSYGYGTCRVAATARRRVWSVQYFSAMDSLILDTLEIGAVPGALLAAPMDLEDSGARLSELLRDAGPAA